MLPGLLWATPGLGQISPEMADLLREARPAERETIENVLKRLNPARRDEIDKLVDTIEDEEKVQVTKSRFVEGWTGDLSLGASSSSGNSKELSLNASVDIRRKGELWEHRANGDFTIKETDGERTEEEFSARYRVRRDIARSPWFVFGTLAFERDRPSGINSRFTEAIGPGYQIIDTDSIDWEVSGGPALRQTNRTDVGHENRLALFLNTDFEWDVTDTLRFRQQLGLAIAEDNTSARSTTSATVNVYRGSSRISLDLDYESDPPTGKKRLDSSTKLSLTFGL